MIEVALREWFPAVVAVVLIGLAWLWNWYRRRPVKDPPAGTPYKVYTTEYDIEIRAEDIARRAKEISAHHQKFWRQDGDPEWIEAVEHVNRKAQEIRQANLLLALPDDLSGLAISFLVDHSGSMRGEAIQAVASTVKVVVETLADKGAKVELLGYTTAGWQGGFVRRRWLARGKPRYPGRLCAVMHIIYKAADDRQLADDAFNAMLNPGILYENIDGEAIEWAERRLLAQPAQRRLLIVISDGAPVDDSTLTQNGPSILWHHIKQVIERIEAAKAINLGAIGINYRVSELYANSVAAEDLAELPAVTSDFVRGMVSDYPPRS